jgi:SOS-response transcriptional repressor LexA
MSETVMLFGRWLEDQYTRRGLDRAEFTRLVSVSHPTVGRWLDGSDTPSSVSIVKIARVLGLDPSDIYARIENRPQQRNVPRSAEEILAELEANQPVAVPIIQDLVAHMGSGGGFIADYWYLPPRYRKSKKKNILGVVAVGECMSPLIEPGDYVVFDTDAPWKKGDIIVAAVNGEMQVKRLIETEKRLVLRGDADGSTLVLGPDDQIFGRVIMFTRPLVPLEM